MDQKTTDQEQQWVEHMAVEPAEVLYSLRMELTSRVVLAWIFAFYGVCAVVAMFQIPETSPAFYEMMEALTAACLFAFAVIAYVLSRSLRKQISRVETRIKSENA